MSNTILPVCLPNCYTYEILEQLKVDISVDFTVYNIPIESLFLMAARKNTKRGFLFVSKILGKHLPVHPLIPLIGGAALAAHYVNIMYNETSFEKNCDFAQALVVPEVRKKTWEYIHRNPLSLPDKTLFIGFAETATGLGYGMFSCFAENAQYIHTTRENILGIDHVLEFTEEHSHATEHYCYAMDPALFANEDMIVLVDDEITTGKSALNFIKAIQSQYPRKQYGVVSLLDWRSVADQQRFVQVERALGIRIHTLSLMAGHITVSGQPVVDDQEEQPLAPLLNPVQSIVEMIVLDHPLGPLLDFSSVNSKEDKNRVPYLQATGRFGITSQEQQQLEKKFQQVGLDLQQKRRGTKTLCLGTGEFMYIPFKIASYMGEGVHVQSTTRSPIYPAPHVGYAIQRAITFASPDDPGLINYAYNIPQGYYDEIFIFLERAVAPNGLESILQALGPLSIPKIYVVICVGNSGTVLLPSS